VPLGGGRAAGIGVIVIPVVCGELGGAETETVHVAKNSEVAIQIVAAFDIQNGGDSAGGAYAFDVRGVAGELDFVFIGRELCEREVREAQGLAGFKSLRIVFLGNEDGKEHGAQTALARAGQIELAVGYLTADIAAMVKLAIDDVNVTVEDERLFV
jgi:hypothetical protein